MVYTLNRDLHSSNMPLQCDVRLLFTLRLKYRSFSENSNVLFLFVVLVVHHGAVVDVFTMAEEQGNKIKYPLMPLEVHNSCACISVETIIVPI